MPSMPSIYLSRFFCQFLSTFHGVSHAEGPNFDAGKAPAMSLYPRCREQDHDVDIGILDMTVFLGPFQGSGSSEMNQQICPFRSHSLGPDGADGLPGWAL